MQFGMRGLLLIMVIASVVFAGLAYLANWYRGGGRSYLLIFVLFTVASPVLVMLLLSLLQRLFVGDPPDESV
jgi:hypothetical protein